MVEDSFQIIICPGIHTPELTQEFLAGLQRCARGNLFEKLTQKLLILPSWDYHSYSAIHILSDLLLHLNNRKIPIIFIAFSAGVVGAIGAAWGWQVLGGEVKALIALDGWGVPLYGNFPIHRLSHDKFTHWSSGLWGEARESFYGDPAVDHLDLWRKVDVCQGWRVYLPQRGVEEKGSALCKRSDRVTAARFIIELLQRYV